MRNLGLLLLLAISACKPSAVKQAVNFTADWESLKQYQVPEWFRDAKFGIYFHWGIYSVPAYRTEWYSHYMYVPDHPIRKYHTETYGPLNEFGYKDFIPMFTAEKFSAGEWVDLFKKAGAKFAGPVTEHADGFAMWDSDLTRFDVMDMGPRRDIVGELEKAIREQGLKFITTFHHQWLYAWYPTWDAFTGTADPEFRDLYGPIVPSTAWSGSRDSILPLPDEHFNTRWYSRVIEVIDKYQPDLIYFDSKLNIIDSTYRLEFLSYYYNRALEWDREVVVTYKHHDLKPWAGVLDLERARMSELKKFPWLTDDSVDWSSWCDVQEPDYKTTDRLIDFLVDVVSKNGCFLLNITPTAAGEIPEPVQQRLLEMGQWLELNGEAIYATRPWKVFGEGPTRVIEGHLNERQNPDNTAEDIRFTKKGNSLYAIVLGIPEDLNITIRSLNRENGIHPGTIQSVSLLGSDQQIIWETADPGLEVTMTSRPYLQHALVFKIELRD
ncbi:MAG: alpha-L-fucosidase [Bacteroides sp. SM23_62]|nr:MAG: alpha-L-fucosidase [Bacteroides sp. SM23_62]